MRHILSGIALAATITFGSVQPGSAQNLFEPVVYVNDGAVTRYEVQQRIRFMQVLGAPDTSAAEAEQALIDDRLRFYAARLMGVEATEEGLQSGLEEFAGRAGMDAAQFTAALEQAGIERQAFRDFVRAGIVWRGVVGRRIIPSIDVSDAEIDQELKRRIETPIITRVLLSELIIPAPEGQEEAAMAQATQIARSNPSTPQFAAAAQQYSAAASAEAGGRLEWLNIDNLPPTLRPIILSLQPGQTSQPLTVPGAVVLFHLRDQIGTVRAGAREQVLDYMTLRMGSATDAAALAARTRYCDDLYVQAGPEAAPRVQRQTASQNAIPTLIATQLASMDPDEASVVNYGTSADLVMLCSRQPALLAESGADVAVTTQAPDGVEAAVPNPDGVPSREAVRNELFNRKANAAAEAYLAELRAEAVIRRP
ncbi:peptidylprolyl isomerase [Paracoccus siganidrum]|uniref:Parvulin-like PPIase n=1 Tax=Paracoccus siganidrum TaxID=1276757 RepID=A0A419A4Y3_9RHOB|nr:peptidylprolyl isomerase [Paracoccus siganidrum]RJL09858.1 peptidylprolyl isomerase [Paracoccus siganidrum]RMC41156.1 peptidylprolyl isomerase [Paracoccus siganidrum]